MVCQSENARPPSPKELPIFLRAKIAPQSARGVDRFQDAIDKVEDRVAEIEGIEDHAATAEDVINRP
jgi:hypothetical protein